MIIGSKKLRESLDIDIVQAFHQQVSEVGELFAAPDSAARADATFTSFMRVSGLGLNLQGMLQAQAEDVCRTRRMTFMRRLYRTARLCLWRPGKR